MCAWLFQKKCTKKPQLFQWLILLIDVLQKTTRHVWKQQPLQIRDYIEGGGGTIYKPENAILQIFIKAHRDEPYKKIISEIINQK